MRISPYLAGAAAALLYLAACHGDDRADAARLADAITAAHPSFAAANQAEQDLIARARVWCNAIAAAGAGHDADLERNTAAAADLSQRAAATAHRLDEIRQSIHRVRLRSDEPRQIRIDLAAQLSRRQIALQEFHAELDAVATQFRALAQDRSYTGDTVPDCVRKIDATLGAWPPAEDTFSPAIADLRNPS